MGSLLVNAGEPCLLWPIITAQCAFDSGGVQSESDVEDSVRELYGLLRRARLGALGAVAGGLAVLPKTAGLGDWAQALIGPFGLGIVSLLPGRQIRRCTTADETGSEETNCY